MPLQEINGNIWNFHKNGFWIVIPTNGFVKNNGECVMGRGLALQAKERFPLLPKMLGDLIKKYGNITFFFPTINLITFPVKYNWWEKANFELIEKSAIELSTIFNERLYIKSPIYVPKVGCGNGKLDWKDVKPILEKHLNEKFVICNFK